MEISKGKWSETELDLLLRGSARIEGPGRRIEFFSRQFLGTRYEESTLIGDMATPEVFVIHLDGVDCFTYIDYVEAMRLSLSFPEFKENLKNIRYRSGRVAFENRNHFFTDWREFNPSLVEDVTEKIGKGYSIKVEKILNRHDDGTCFLPGIPLRKRKLDYIPSGSASRAVLDNLKTGDYAGIYTEASGLDVSHVGIVIRVADGLNFRHASSTKEKRMVVNEPFEDYIQGRPGLIVLRPKEKPCTP